MSTTLTQFLQFLSSPSFSLWQTIGLVYVGLLWLSIIIWVTRDSISRSNSLIFQVFAILINIAIPILGVVLYLIIRPGKTNLERYYEDMEQQLLTDQGGDKVSCPKCLTQVDKNYIHCPNCALKLKRACSKCHKNFPTLWNICPYCGSEYRDNSPEPAKRVKKIPKMKDKK